MTAGRRKKLILTYVDSLRTDMLQRAVAEGRAPSFGALLERGVLVPDCVSSFPSVTPVACSEMVTGVGADQHWISGMNWYHRLERRYVEYGSSFEASRAFGVFRALYDLVFGASRREGSGAGALGFIVALAALVVLAIALVFSWAIIAVVFALLWLGISRHRRAQRKHAGLRVLR